MSSFEPRVPSNQAKLDGIFAKHSLGASDVDVNGPMFKAMLMEVSDSFDLRLDAENFICDAKRELEGRVDAREFMQAMDIVSTLLDVYTFKAPL